MFHFLKLPCTSILWTFALLLSSCGVMRYPVVKDVVGEYVYKYKSGQIEVWTLTGDVAYKQEFFDDFKGYSERATPRYTNAGTWTLSDRTITFVLPLNFFDYGNRDKPLEKPERMSAQPSIWIDSGTNAGKIAIGEDIDYVLTRVTERNAE
jgi:hypothetical protein